MKPQLDREIRTKQFIKIAEELKEWLEERELKLGYTDTYLGQLALLIQDKITQAQATTKQELVQEIEKMDVKENQPSYWIEIFKPSQLGIALDGLESFKRKVLEVLQKEKE